jgi:hypothetical protein
MTQETRQNLLQSFRRQSGHCMPSAFRSGQTPEKSVYFVYEGQSMTEQVALIKEIDTLPSRYIGEVLDYIGYLRQKARNENADDIEAYKAMAADTEREMEAVEWCNAYFGPVDSRSAHPA